MDKSEWISLVLSKAGGKGLSPAQLQKAIFLLQKFFPKELKGVYKFKAYNYGPFDVSIYRTADSMCENGLIEFKAVPGRSWYFYKLSAQGVVGANELITKFPQPILDYTDKLITWIQSVSFQELVSAIYKKYPAFKKNSVFKG